MVKKIIVKNEVIYSCNYIKTKKEQKLFLFNRLIKLRIQKNTTKCDSAQS